jgi:hypothetical protein
LKVAELKKSGLKGTPVTPESFALWQDKKRKRRAEENRKIVATEMRKKKGGKGLGVLSGRALYEFKKDLFDKGDDDAGIDIPEDEEETPENGDAEEEHTVKDAIAMVQLEQLEELFLEGDENLDDLDDDDA